MTVQLLDREQFVDRPLSERNSSFVDRQLQDPYRIFAFRHEAVQRLLG